MAKDVVIPKGMEAYYNDFHFAPAVKDGDRLYCSGQIGVGEGYKVSDDPETQFTQAFEHVKSTLEAAGASFDNVVEMTTFHVDLQKKHPGLHEGQRQLHGSPLPGLDRDRYHRVGVSGCPG